MKRLEKELDRMEAHFNPKAAAQRLAKERGVELVASAPAEAPRGVVPPGWFAQHMPDAAQLLADVKAGLPPDMWRDVIANLKRVAGYVVDVRARLALGSPPLQEWDRGKVAQREGFDVMRVRPVGQVGEASSGAADEA